MHFSSTSFRVMAVLIFCVLLASASLCLGAEKKPIAPPGMKPVGPYSPGILVGGDVLYVSGQNATDSQGKLAPTFEGQLTQAFENMKAIVEAAGLKMENVVYCQFFVDDATKTAEIERVWKTYFPKEPPARALIGAYKIPVNSVIDVNAVAIRDLSKRKLIVPSGYPSNLPYTPGVIAGDKLYISNVFGADVATGKIPQDPDAQVELALDNMKQILTAAGLDFGHVIFVNPFLTANASSKMNEIYAKRFQLGNAPARATIRVTTLPNDNTIEFTGVAVTDLSKRQVVRVKNMRLSPTSSPCVFGGDTLYCSAKSAFIPGPNQGIYASTVENQVRQTMRNLLDGLEEAGLNFSNVVSTNVYLDDMNDFTKMNRVYGSYFTGMAPTRITLAQVAPVSSREAKDERYPTLEQISLIAVK